MVSHKHVAIHFWRVSDQFYSDYKSNLVRLVFQGDWRSWGDQWRIWIRVNSFNLLQLLADLKREDIKSGDAMEQQVL